MKTTNVINNARKIENVIGSCECPTTEDIASNIKANIEAPTFCLVDLSKNSFMEINRNINKKALVTNEYTK
jgi:hypothetical protein